MKNPFARRPEPARPDDTAEALRARLAEQAVHAPTGEFLAERIIARAEAAHGAGAQRPRVAPARAPWGRIAAAAAAVAVVAGGVVAVTQYDPSPDRPVADRSTALTTPTASAPVSTSSPDPTAQRTDEPTTNASAARVITVSKLTNIRVVDVTFTGGRGGWGLASADCLLGPGRCTALLRTTDGARVWKSRPNTPFQVPGVQDCAAPCVRHIRFATDEIGYAYGPSAMFVTTDGAQTWRRVDGGADALETLDGNVIRVDTSDGRRRVRTADIGSTDWTTVPLPGGQGPAGRADATVTLTRSGSAAYLLATGEGTNSVLWSSADDGASWTNAGEACVQRGGAVDAQEVTTAADGAVVLLCRERADGGQFVSVSTDDGRSFTAARTALGSFDAGAVGAASARTVLVSGEDTFRSTDGGGRFVRLGANAGGTPGAANYLGFSSDTDAHAISTDARTIWTTSDAGATWTAARFR